jgi:hypothetical protein
MVSPVPNGLILALRKRLPEGGTFPLPATERELAAAERVMGFEFPAGLRQIYEDLSNGGFGPAYGLYSCIEAAEKYRSMQCDPKTREELGLTMDDPEWVLYSEENRIRDREYIPICDYGCGNWWYVNRQGQVFFTGADFLTHHISFDEWMRPEGPSVEAWLHRWLDGEEEPRAYGRPASGASTKAPR